MTKTKTLQKRTFRSSAVAARVLIRGGDDSCDAGITPMPLTPNELARQDCAWCPGPSPMATGDYPGK